MRLKKGFTLAEILIVLMVIGVIATLTIPSMMRGVQEAQLKAGYKKAFNTVANFASMERVAGSLPTRGTPDNITNLYRALNNSLSVKTMVPSYPVNNGSAFVGATNPCLTGSIGDGTNTIDVTIGSDVGTCGQLSVVNASAGLQGGSPSWMLTEDNISYAILPTTGHTDTNCATIQQIANRATDALAVGDSCAIVIVDVNGIGKLPNTMEPQGLQGDLDAGDDLETLAGDQYKIYLGSDGASAGPRTGTVTGRIIADVK